jgi:ribosome maturation factor RimP
MSRSEYESRTEALLKPILSGRNFELVDVEYVKEGGNWYLRAYIDKPGGITVDDCELVSRDLEAELDREDYIEDSYILEVSSPGLGRPLKKDKDYARNEGKEVEIHLFRPFEHEKQWQGILTAWDSGSVRIRTEEGRELTFSRKELALIREAFDF